MKILLIGSGGREHALAWAISGSALTESLVIAPGSDAMATLGRCAGVAADDLDGLLALAEAERPDLVVVGPEAPLVAGLVDRLEAAGVPVAAHESRCPAIPSMAVSCHVLPFAALRLRE